jgi:hypothetical protein
MADTIAVPSSPPRDAAAARRDERYFYRAIALLFLAVVFAGFARTYYLRPLFIASPLPSWIVHAHGVVMTAWVVLFVTQVGLISAKRVRLHQRLGYAGIGLAALMVIIGLATAANAAKYGSASTPPQFSQPGFSIVPLGDLLLFMLFFGGAIAYRRHPATHKRLMLLTVLNFLPPSVGRMPFASVQASPVPWLLGIIVGVAVACVALDWWRSRRVYWLFVGGAVLLVASFPIRIALMTTPGWVRFATWFASFA